MTDADHSFNSGASATASSVGEVGAHGWEEGEDQRPDDVAHPVLRGELGSELAEAPAVLLEPSVAIRAYRIVWIAPS